MSPRIEITELEYQAVLDAGVALDMASIDDGGKEAELAAIAGLRLKMRRALDEGSGAADPQPPVRLRVYSWTNHRKGKQTREIMAARSAAQVMRTASISRSTWAHSGGVTMNDVEIAQAMSKPGVVFWALLSDAIRGVAEWHEVEQ